MKQLGDYSIVASYVHCWLELSGACFLSASVHGIVVAREKEMVCLGLEEVVSLILPLPNPFQ